MEKIVLNNEQIFSLELSLKKSIYLELHKEGLLNDDELLELITKLSSSNNCSS